MVQEISNLSALATISIMLVILFLLYLSVLGYIDKLINELKLWIKYFVMFLIGFIIIFYSVWPNLNRVGMMLVGLAITMIAVSWYSEDKTVLVNWNHIPMYKLYSNKWEEESDE
jgi:hypothetical protein